MRQRLGQMLGQLVAAEIDDDQTAPQLIMPTPMHWRRRLVRGWDHARALAGAIARELRLPVGNELVRLRNTPQQARLPRSRRIENVRGAFAVRKGDGLVGASILLVDDVTTTGATANEAARTLLQAGAARVTLAVVAKSEPPTAYARRTSV
jgi:ComF family protein